MLSPSRLKRLAPLLSAAAAVFLLGLPAASAPSAPTRVAVLVHGYLGFDLASGGSTCTARAMLYGLNTPNEWGRVADTLRSAGWRVYFAHWHTGPASSSTIAEAATCLATQIADVKRVENASRITLIAHSMGGLVARAYFEGAAAPNDVERLVTFGAPHLGVNFQQFLKLASLIKLTDASFDASAYELSFEGVRAFNALHPRRPLTAYYLVGGTHEGWSSFIVNPDGRIPNDGLMYTASALGLRDSGVGRFTVDDVHADLLRKPFDAAREYVFSENSLSCLRSILAIAGPRSCRPAPATPMLAAAETLNADDSPSFSPTLEGDLAPGESRTLPVLIGGDTTVALSWRGNASAWLRSPRGDVITPDLLSPPGHKSTIPPAIGELPANQSVAVFAIPNAAPGAWQLHVTAAHDGPVRYLGFGSFDSPIRLQVHTPPAMLPGSLFSLTADLTDLDRPLDGAAVAAELITPNSRRRVRLTPVGDGSYAGVLTAPAEPATLRILASGHTSDGLPFEEEKTAPLMLTGQSQSPASSEPTRAFLPFSTH